MLSLPENTTVAVVNKVTYGASFSAVFFGLTANEVAAIGGLIVAVLALIINAGTTWYFKSQHLKLAREIAAQGHALKEEDGD